MSPVCMFLWGSIKSISTPKRSTYVSNVDRKASRTRSVDFVRAAFWSRYESGFAPGTHWPNPRILIPLEDSGLYRLISWGTPDFLVQRLEIDVFVFFVVWSNWGMGPFWFFSRYTIRCKIQTRPLPQHRSIHVDFRGNAKSWESSMK